MWNKRDIDRITYYGRSSREEERQMMLDVLADGITDRDVHEVNQIIVR